jgi:dTDP-4-amino-4,6-dideoxygalactose transaminase
MFVIQAPRRDDLQNYLKEKGIGTGIHYPVPIHLQKSMSFLGYKPGDLPVTEAVVGKIISLPMFAELTDTQIEEVCEAIKGFYA